jgi:dTMP kinase
MHARRASGGQEADRMEGSGAEFYERVRRGYRALAGAEPERFVTVDGMRPVEIVEEDIWRALSRRLQVSEALM